MIWTRVLTTWSNCPHFTPAQATMTTSANSRPFHAFARETARPSSHPSVRPMTQTNRSEMEVSRHRNRRACADQHRHAPKTAFSTSRVFPPSPVLVRHDHACLHHDAWATVRQGGGFNCPYFVACRPSKTKDRARPICVRDAGCLAIPLPRVSTVFKVRPPQRCVAHCT
jgi:hypothetical protein